MLQEITKPKSRTQRAREAKTPSHFAEGQYSAKNA